jgi:L-rhamnose-H+ transport protein
MIRSSFNRRRHSSLRHRPAPLLLARILGADLPIESALTISAREYHFLYENDQFGDVAMLVVLATVGGKMTPNPLLGLVFHWIGGLASASFYIPYRGVKNWAWETYWLVGGFFSWIIAPWTLALFMTHDLLRVLGEASVSTLFWTYFFGVLWGVGGLTFGLTMRYLGISLGMAVALGFCAAFGTLIPPIFNGEFATKVLGTNSGLVILLGVLVCIAGIGVSGMAGMTKENEMSQEQKRAVIKEFNFRKGILVATFSGVMSACFSYGLAAGEPIKGLTVAHGTAPLWQGLPVLVVVLFGGFTTNFIWCVYLNITNRTGGQYFAPTAINPVHDSLVLETAIDAPGEEMARQAHVVAHASASTRVPLVANYLFCALAGLTWYFQFFFYTMGESQMGQYKFSSWTLHMASIIIFSTLWGLALKEWRGASSRAMTFLVLSLAVLVGSTIIIGYGNYLGSLTFNH